MLDPVYTYTLPPRQVANGVVDAFVHTVEQYVTKPVDAKIQDRFAEGILLTLIEDGPKALKEPENYDVRANVMWGATPGAERFDWRWRTAGLGNAYAGPRTDCDARSGSRANTGYRPAWHCGMKNARPSALSCCNMLNASGTSLKVPMMSVLTPRLPQPAISLSN